MIDLSFAIQGTILPADHGYLLYSGLSRILPSVHHDRDIAIHPIRGRIIGDRQLQLCDWSRLVIRASTENITSILPLAGKQILVGNKSLRIGVPEVRGLVPSSALRSRLVVIKISNIDAAGLTPELFIAAARKQLASLGISEQAVLSFPAGRENQPRRRTLRVKDREIVGYEVHVEGLNAEESLVLQVHGLGGRRHMGCGVFSVIAQKAEDSDA